jgi:hypothetical protein
MLVKVLTPKASSKAKESDGENDEAYPGQKQLFEEMRLMEIRRVEQETEIQRLIMREKEFSMMNMKNIVRYLQQQTNATKIAEEEAKRLRREAREKALANAMMMANANSNKTKKKKKQKPRWLQLYEDSERRMTKAKQRKMKLKKASSEALNLLPKSVHK